MSSALAGHLNDRQYNVISAGGYLSSPPAQMPSLLAVS
jgi:hypothetical protein